MTHPDYSNQHRPPTYRPQNGCHNCRFMHDASGPEGDEFLCKLDGVEPPVRPGNYEQEEREDYWEKWEAWETGRHVRGFGICDQHELREDQHGQHGAATEGAADL